MCTNENVLGGVQEEWQVSDEERQQAKQIAYGLVYGMGCRTLADQLDVAEDEARLFVDAFHARFAGVRPFIDATVARCRADGYVETLHGRRRHLPAINSASATARGNILRQHPLENVVAKLELVPAGFYQVSMGFTWYHWVSLGFYQVSMGFY